MPPGAEAERSAILAALPGTMFELYQRTGIQRHQLRELVQAMRWDGLLHRRPAGVYAPGPAPARGNGHDEPLERALPAPIGGKGRKRAYLLVSVPGWPVQDPGRVMIHSDYATGQDAVEAAREMRREYPGWKWTVARLRSSHAATISRAKRYAEHPARARGS